MRQPRVAYPLHNSGFCLNHYKPRGARPFGVKGVGIPVPQLAGDCDSDIPRS